MGVGREVNGGEGVIQGRRAPIYALRGIARRGVILLSCRARGRLGGGAVSAWMQGAG
jgi:hypothetical protein